MMENIVLQETITKDNIVSTGIIGLNVALGLGGKFLVVLVHKRGKQCYNYT